MNQEANMEATTPSRSLKKGMLGKDEHEHRFKSRAMTYTSAITNATAQMTVQIPIHVAHPTTV